MSGFVMLWCFDECISEFSSLVTSWPLNLFLTSLTLFTKFRYFCRVSFSFSSDFFRCRVQFLSVSISFFSQVFEIWIRVFADWVLCFWGFGYTQCGFVGRCVLIFWDFLEGWTGLVFGGLDLWNSFVFCKFSMHPSKGAQCRMSNLGCRYPNPQISKSQH